MLHKVRSKYIYFKNFMICKRDVAVSIAVLLLVVFGGIYLYVANYQSPEEKETAAIMEGKTRDMGGIVTGINYKKNEFVLRTMRPSGEYEEYIIHIGRKTEFFFLTEEVAENFVDDFEFEPAVEYKENVEEKPASFEDVKVGAKVMIYFDERVAPDSDWRLMAKTVKIVNQINDVIDKEENEEDF